MADRKHGHPQPGTETEVLHQDWDSRDLSGETHTRVAFAEMDMTEATNVGAVFDMCTFRDVLFNASTHADAAFINCTFTRSNFFDATFTRCKLTGSRFDRCKFGILKVSGGDWSFVGLPGADLRSATFENVRMREADLTGARLDGATVRGVDLSGAWLDSAKLSGCDLRGSDLSSVDPLTVELNRTIIDMDQAVTLAVALGLDVRPE